jgi:arylsulfatase A-like enzyme
MKKEIALLALVFCATVSFAAARPNVVMIAVDDMNDWIGPMGNTYVKTPNLDRLAQRGITFQNAHTVGIFCAPSRASLFTGRLPSTTGCYEETPTVFQCPQFRPLQEAFHESGYETYGMGKLYHHIAGFLDLRGWTEYNTQTGAQKSSGWGADSWDFEGVPLPDPYPHSLFNQKARDPEKAKKAGFMESAPLPNAVEENMADTLRANWAAEVLGRKHGKPFFLGVGFYAPHFPNYAPKKYFDLYDSRTMWRPELKAGDLDDLPPKIRKAQLSRKASIHDKLVELGILDEAMLGYMSCISYADAMVGRVLDALDKSPYRDNTVIVLWSDNGYHLGEKGQWGKHTLWQRTTNVPMLWAGPGLARGASIDASAMLTDIYPTLVELCGLKPDPALEGKSLAGALKNPALAKDRPVLTVAEKDQYSVVNTQWRYIHYADGTEELYDEKNDPHEWKNLAENPEFEKVKEKMNASAPKRFADAGKKRGELRLVIEGETFHWEDKKVK